MKRLFCVFFLLAGAGLASDPALEAQKIDALLAADWQQRSLQGNGPFGIGSCHIHNRSAQDAAHWVPQMQTIGLRYYRSSCTGWSRVE